MSNDTGVQYARDIRKATKKDKHLRRRVSDAEKIIFEDPSAGELKTMSRGSRGSVLASLIRGYGVVYARNIGKHRLLYHYNRSDNTILLLRFGTHKQLYQGPGHTM